MGSDSTILLGYEQKKILFNAKVVDGIQFLESSIMKLKMAHLELCSIRNIKKDIRDSYLQWNSELMNKGSVADFPEAKFNYFSNTISDDIALCKVTSSSFNYLHSFFDNYAQFLNTTLLANIAKDINHVKFNNISNMLKKESEYRELSGMIDSCINSPMYKYIEDYNNVIKHQFNISVDSRLYLNDGDLKTNLPGFEKKKSSDCIHIHQAIELETNVYNSYEFARKFCIETTQRVYEILKKRTHPYTQNRHHIANVIIQFPNQKKNIKRVTQVYIKTNRKVEQGDKYYFLFSEDNGVDISLNNSTYKSIIIKNTDNKVIGMLTADDPKIMDDSIDKVVLFQYRKYTVNVKDYVSTYISHLKNTEKISAAYGDVVIIRDPDDD